MLFVVADSDGVLGGDICPPPFSLEQNHLRI